MKEQGNMGPVAINSHHIYQTGFIVGAVFTCEREQTTNRHSD